MRHLTTALLVSACALPAFAAAPDEAALAREIYQQLVDINTTDSVGDNTAAAQAMQKRFRDAGVPESDMQLLAPHERKGNLVVRFHGTGKRKPLLLVAHLDVVEAKREDWSIDPFQFLEKDGYYYGRGSADDKAMASIFVANLLRLKREGYVPDRDLILALTSDEEGGDWNGVDFLVKEHRPLVDAAYGLNEGGRGQIKDGRYLANTVGTSEKVYLSFSLEAKNSGGHSSVPRKDNAIYELSAALLRVAAFTFPVRLTETTRLYFERLAASQPAELAAAMRGVAKDPPDPAAVAQLSEIPIYASTLRTTCVATRLEGGHADNALPQTAKAVVNCRMHPNDPPDWVRDELVKAIEDPQLGVTPIGSAHPSPESPINPELFGAVEKLTEAMWPGVPVLPTMGTGATDSLYLRGAGVPMYGVSGIFGDVGDNRAHGKDERVLVKSYHEGREFLYRLVKALSS